MDTNRRDFVRTMTTTAAGLSLAAAMPALAAQPDAAAPAGSASRPRGRKMIVRADDVGHSTVCNIGTFEAIDHGVVTAVDIMLDSPGTVDALERLRAYPWLSLGWHTHMWGAPVLDAKRVPSLVESGGPFDGRFRMDLARAPDVVQEQAVAELRAQLGRCLRVLGRVPDTGGSGNADTTWGRAIRQVNEEFGLVYNFTTNLPASESYLAKIRQAQQAGAEWARHYSLNPGGSQADPKWAQRKIHVPAGTTAYVDLLTDSIAEVERNYDPVRFYTEDRAGILRQPDDWISMQAWHPGYVDYYVYRLGERVNRARAQQFVVGRTQDVAALCDPRLKQWIRQNRIELVNTRDALYGTRQYQNHLQDIGSDLAIS